MSLIRITNGFNTLTDARLLERANFIHQSMNGNPSFGSPSPTMPAIEEAIAALTLSVQKAGNGDRLMVAQKNADRDMLIEMLHLLSYFVLYASGGDQLKAFSSGFTLAKEPVPQPEIQKPTGLKVANSDQSGTLLISTKKVKGAAAYMHQYTADPLQKEDSWMTMTCTQTRCKLEGLTPGTTYFFRVGAVGPKDQIMYSDVAMKIAA